MSKRKVPIVVSSSFCVFVPQDTVRTEPPLIFETQVACTRAWDTFAQGCQVGRGLSRVCTCSVTRTVMEEKEDEEDDGGSRPGPLVELRNGGNRCTPHNRVMDVAFVGCVQTISARVERRFEACSRAAHMVDGLILAFLAFATPSACHGSRTGHWTIVLPIWVANRNINHRD